MSFTEGFMRVFNNVSLYGLGITCGVFVFSILLAAIVTILVVLAAYAYYIIKK